MIEETRLTDVRTERTRPTWQSYGGQRHPNRCRRDATEDGVNGTLRDSRWPQTGAEDIACRERKPFMADLDQPGVHVETVRTERGVEKRRRSAGSSGTGWRPRPPRMPRDDHAADQLDQTKNSLLGAREVPRVALNVGSSSDRRANSRPCATSTLSKANQAVLLEARIDIHRWLSDRARRRGIGHLRDELLSLADLALVLAIRAWRPERGPFRPFAWRYVKRETLQYLRTERRQSDVAESVAVERDRWCEGEEAHDTSLDLLRGLTGQYPRELIALGFAHFVDGVPLRELAEAHGCSFRRIRDRVGTFVDAVNDVRGGGPDVGGSRRPR